ncbi:PorP/SprF family type IX secretion system membrane protein [Maribellus maritimus]|uniref:PorP/SprF family type IX secretion system membrane protein n=1 Tax=Maribellus maritimus TaxID=2870838 RepID=UPI001EEC0E05|nr:PorP/SprF family type IX secretion system membrane protein [Maribellus maritimus]MCG6189932.1 PorP/SprF family type IX secretion system membrane protein [Maribellus maritimus]
MRRTGIILFLLSLHLLFNKLRAQDFPYHYFNHISPIINNPSLAALNSKIEVNSASYSMWAGGFKPVNDYLVSFAISPNPKDNLRRSYFQPYVGLGAVFLHEDIGPFNQNILQLIYAYHIPVTRTNLLSFGVNVLVENLEINVNELTARQADDPRLLSGNNNSIRFDGGFGASLSGRDFRVSLSVLNLMPADYKFNNNSVSDLANYRKFFISGNYRIVLNDKFTFQPNLVLRNTVEEKIGFDSMADFNLYLLSVGMGYRTESSIFVFAKIPFHNFFFSYTSENPLKSNHMIGNGHIFSVGWVWKQTDR